MAQDKSADEKQLAAAREIADRHHDAPSTLAGHEHASEEFQRRLEIARERMKKYASVYRALAK